MSAVASIGVGWGIICALVEAGAYGLAIVHGAVLDAVWPVDEV
jgi:hypothetical protein